IELTQPQGHSTSGSHERYKSKERLDFEVEFDCIKKMREWMIGQGIATADEIDQLEREDVKAVREAQRRAWDAYRQSIDADVKQAVAYIEQIAPGSPIAEELRRNQAPFRRDAMRSLASALIASHVAPPPSAAGAAGRDVSAPPTRPDPSLTLGATSHVAPPPSAADAATWLRDQQWRGDAMYDLHLYSESADSAL